MMTPEKLNELRWKPDERAELELMMASKERLLAEMRDNPQVATQFFKDIGLLDAEGNRVVLPGEEPETQNGRSMSNGDHQ